MALYQAVVPEFRKHDAQPVGIRHHSSWDAGALMALRRLFNGGQPAARAASCHTYDSLTSRVRSCVPSRSVQGCFMMKIDVSYEALLQALVEAIRTERDHGAAMMSLVSRLVDEACQQDWFEAHWRTDARLRLAQMACGHMFNGWRSAVPVLEVIAEAARCALKAEEIDSEARATLLAIMRLADVERAGRAAAEPKPRPVAKYARRRKANGAGFIRQSHRAALAKPAASPQAMALDKTRPAAAKAAPARKPKRSKSMGRSRTTAQAAKPVVPPQAMALAKTRPAAAKAAPARTAKRSKSMSRSGTTAQAAKPVVPPQAMAVAKIRPTAAKAAQVRTAKRSKSMSRSGTTAQAAKPVVPPQAMAVAKIRPTAAKAAQVRTAKRSKSMSRSGTTAQAAKPAAPPQAMAVAKTRPTAAKAVPVRTAKRSKSMSRSHTAAQLAKPAAPPHAAPVAQVPSAAQAAPARKPNGAGRASTKPGAPAVAT
jgi:hypothetical protein